jgi:hypothetical protein
LSQAQKDVTFIRIIILQLTFKNAGKKQYKFGCEKMNDHHRVCSKSLHQVR